MNFLRLVNNKVLNVYDVVQNFFADLKKKKWFYPVLFTSIFLIIFLSFFLLTYTHPIYEGTLYREGNVYSEGKAIREQYQNTFLNQLNTNYILIGGIIIIALISLVFIYLLINKRMSFTLGIVYIFLLALVIRLIYMGYCDAIFKNQHDVWSDYNVGHFSITFHIFYTGNIPPLFKDFNMSYQLYHFKTSHTIFALWMHVMKLFVGNNEYVLYQSIKIISTAMSMGIVVLTYYILKELNLSKRALIFALILTISFPTLVILGANTNNDTCLIFFTYLAIYFAIRFYKNQNWINVILLAIFMGLTVSTKLSGALIALPIGVMMIYIFIKSIKNKNWTKILLFYVVFALICFPIGFAWAIINFKVYGYPLTYVWQVTNNNLKVTEDVVFFDRYLFVDIIKFFQHPYVILAGEHQDYNFFEFLLKSQLFGEWSLTSNLNSIAYVMVGLSFVFVIFMFLLFMYFVMKLVLTKQFNKLAFYVAPLIITFGASALFGKETDQVIGLGIILLGLVIYAYWFLDKKRFFSKTYLSVISIYTIYVVSYTYFNLKEPFTCTMDIRYMIPMLLVIAYFVGVYIDKFLIDYKKVLANK